MTIKVAVADAKKRFSELLGRVAYGQARVIITRRGKPIAALVPLSDMPPAALDEDGDWLYAIQALAAETTESSAALDHAMPGEPAGET
jgi:prevent-host-death family protein